MSLTGLSVFQQSLLGVRGLTAGRVVKPVCVPPGHRGVRGEGDSSLGVDNLAHPYTTVRYYAANRMDTDEAEYEDED